MSSCPFGQLLIRLGQTLEGSDPCTRFCAWSQFHYLWILKYMVHQTKDFCFPSFFVFCLLINNLMTAQTSHRDVLRSRLKDIVTELNCLEIRYYFWIHFESVDLRGDGGGRRGGTWEHWWTLVQSAVPAVFQHRIQILLISSELQLLSGLSPPLTEPRLPLRPLYHYTHTQSQVHLHAMVMFKYVWTTLSGLFIRGNTSGLNSWTFPYSYTSSIFFGIGTYLEILRTFNGKIPKPIKN